MDRPARLLQRSWGLIAALGLGSVGYAGLALLAKRDGTLRGATTPSTIGLYLVAFIGFVLAVWWNERHPISVRWLWGVAIVFRLFLLSAPPTLSDDVYRYLWEGHLVTEGVSPYAHPVDASQLDAYETGARPLVNNAELASPYLPVAHVVFGAAAFLLPSEPWVLQGIMVGVELVGALFLARLLTIAALPSRRLLLYLWNPLVIVEIAHGAHLDALMVAGSLGAVYATLRPPGGHRWVGPVVLALATLTRPTPLLLLAVLWWRWTWRQRALYGGILAGVLVPLGLWSGWGLGAADRGTGLFGSARVYSAEFRFNSGIAHWLEAGLGTFDDPAAATRLVLGVVLGGVLGFVWWAARSAPDDLAWLRLLAVPLVAYVLLTPVMHPWYLVFVAALVPLLTPGPLERRVQWLVVVPWLYLSAALVLSYLTYVDPLAFGEREWVRRVEWFPTLGLVVVAWACRRPSIRSDP